MSDTLDHLRELAKKHKCGTMATRLKSGEVVILVTANAATPEQDIMLAMARLFPDDKPNLTQH